MASIAPLSPPDSFHVVAAIGWLELGNAREARTELEQLVAAHREHPDALEAWWKIFGEEKDWSRALGCAEKLVAVAPERVTGWIDQSYALHELKRTREACERLSVVVQKFREHFVIPYNLACYECQSGNNEAALAWLRRAAEVAGIKTIRAMAAQDADLAPLREAIAHLEP